MIVYRKNLSLLKIQKTLGPLEEKILFLVKKKSSPRDVLKKIKGKKYAYTTVMTVMNRLYKKGFLKREKIKKTYYYSPVVNLKKISKLSLINLIHQLNFFVCPLKFLGYFLLVQTLIQIERIWILLLKETLLKTIFFLLTSLSLFNFIMRLYLNGVFEFINLFLVDPQLLFNFTILSEMILVLELFILSLLIFISWKIITSPIKKRQPNSYYQFKLFNL